MDDSRPLRPPHLPFFVYGTLLPGQPNYHVWGGAVLAETAATLAGCRLYDLGNYPMLVELEDPEEVVLGLLVELDLTRYMPALARVDRLEGCDVAGLGSEGYQRVIRTVRTRTGNERPAWVYLGSANHVDGFPMVAGGDWQRYSRTRLRQLETWWSGVDSIAGQLGRLR